MSDAHHLGQRLSYDGALCTIRYIGEVPGTSGTWLGVEWDEPSRGKHDGQHKGVRPADAPQSFVAALLDKYAKEGAKIDARGAQGQGQGQQLNPYSNPDVSFVFFGKKVAEEVGFDKIRRQLARVDELKIVILDGMRIAWDVAFADGGKGVKDTSPLISELDLSRNLFESFGTVCRICRELESLRTLRLNGNRFQILHEDETSRRARNAFAGVRELELEQNLLNWETICQLATQFPSLAVLSGSLNQLDSLPPVNLGTLTGTLTTLSLEFNEFTSLSDLATLASLPSLRSLQLKGNSISTIRPNIDVPPPIFSPTLVYVDVSYNAISTWSFVDALPTSFPGLTALRLAHNPIYDNPDLDIETSTKVRPSGVQTKASEEAHMIATARLPNLKSLNFGPITTQDRTNAELFYLSRIGKQLAAVPENEEARVLTRHPLYAALCDQYGEPDVIRRDEVNPAFLEARLVKVRFYLAGASGASEEAATSQTTEVPRSFDVYAVQGIAGSLFGLAPLSVRLVWETGEWDPVFGFDEEVGSSDSEDEGEDEEAERERELEADLVREAAAAAAAAAGNGAGPGEQIELGKQGRWVKREVVLAEGPRQLGFCVDGLEVTIRVEVR